MEVKKIAVTMTLTENSIELASRTGVNVIIAHHPVVDGCSCGGMALKDYLGLYNIAVFELHEAFHGLHSGIPWLHGHEVIWSDANYGGIKGNYVYVGKVFKRLNTLEDIIGRLNDLMGIYDEIYLRDYLLDKAMKYKEGIFQTTVFRQGTILLGDEDSLVENILHIFPHTGFNENHLEDIVKEFPKIDTVIVSVSKVYKNHPLVKKAQDLGLNFICGSSHVMEIFENGIPLAMGVKKYLEDVTIVIFRDITASIPLEVVSTEDMRRYGKNMANKYL